MSIPFVAIFFTFGTLVGSFVGVVAERTYTGQSWKKGRSRCNSCREYLSARDLVPIFSWLFHRGRCRRCGSRVPGAYAVYELLMGAAFSASYIRCGLTLPIIPLLLALTILGLITIYDLRHTIVPLAAAFLFIGLSALYAVLSYSPAEISLSVIYAAGIALFFFLMYALSRGRAMGLGDTPISFGLAFLVGHASLAGFLFSFWIGGVIGIIILAVRKGGPRMGVEVPFVPFMALGFLIAFFTQWNPLPF